LWEKVETVEDEDRSRRLEDARPISAGALAGMLCDGGEIALVDVREVGQFGLGHMLHAVSAPYSRLELKIAGLVPNPRVRMVLIDQDDGIAARAARRLQALGYDNIYILTGGVDAWVREGFELFEGVHVPSKAFGEILAEENGTEMIAPADLAGRMGDGNAPLLLDIRPYGEYHHQTVPGAVNCPGAELIYRIADLAGDETTPVVVTCAGRTRGIIAAEMLRRSGLKNPVTALKDGTMGWYKAGFDLIYGETARFGGRSPVATDWSRQAASRMAEESSVPSLTLEQLNTWRADCTRTLYVLDVREPAEYEAGHLTGSTSAPGGQLIQATDNWIGVHGARLVLVDDDSVRAIATAVMLRAMGLDAHVLNGGLDAASGPVERGNPPSPRAPDRTPRIGARKLMQAISDRRGQIVIVDVGTSGAYREAHLPGAVWCPRPRLDRLALDQGTEMIIVSADDEDLADLAAADLREIIGIETRVLAGGNNGWIEAGLASEVSQDRPTDGERIDFLFWAHDRHQGNVQSIDTYLGWEGTLPDRVRSDRIRLRAYTNAGQ
jgi:cystathionine beta-lyase